MPWATLTDRRVGQGSVLWGGEQGDATQASLPLPGLRGNGDPSISLPTNPRWPPPTARHEAAGLSAAMA